MKEVVFVTGNAQKAKHMSRLLGIQIKHQKIDLDEIQSLDLQAIAKDKALRAYTLINKPVIVEDVSLEISGMSGLPGPFIKFFMDKMGSERICDLIKEKDRSATARCVIVFYDGQMTKVFEGFINGKIADSPAGPEVFGWDNIFIPEGYTQTRACLDEQERDKVYKTIKPLDKLKEFLGTY